MFDYHKYVTQYKNLKYVIELRVIVKTAYRVISFKQRPWLKSYIDFNTDKRKYAKNAFENYIL